MDYQTFEPSVELKDLIKCYWTLEGPVQPEAVKQRIVPDGCMEMLFHYGDLYRQFLPDGTSIIQPRCFVFGQITAALEIQPTGTIGIFSVRFNPEGFTPFSTFPLGQMKDRATTLEEIYGEEGWNLGHRVLSAKSTNEKIKICESFFMGRLINKEAIDRIVRSSVEVILRAQGRLSVKELSKQVEANRRKLERNFVRKIGLSPKQLAKIIRLQATLKLLTTQQFTSLTDLAYRGGYYDQAHFIKDFKEFTGQSPKNFFAENFKMSSLFSGNE